MGYLISVQERSGLSSKSRRRELNKEIWESKNFLVFNYKAILGSSH